MIPLPTQFTKNQRGFAWHYRQVARKGLLAIYHRTSGEKNQDWEVIRIRENKEGDRPDFNNPGKTVFVEARESYPTDNDWGSRGWTFISEEEAWRKFDELRNHPDRPVNVDGNVEKVPLEALEGQCSGGDTR